MGKHILGFAIFSFIFISFAFAFAFFKTPIPQITEVKHPYSIEEPTTKCRKKPEKTQGISARVISSQLFLDENKVVSKIKIGWENYSAPPAQLHVKVTFFNLKDGNRNSFGDLHILENPFSNSREKIITVVSRISDNKKFDEKENLYAFFDIYKDVPTVKYDEGNRDLAYAKEVLIVHGDGSIIKK